VRAARYARGVGARWLLVVVSAGLAGCGLSVSGALEGSPMDGAAARPDAGDGAAVDADPADDVEASFELAPEPEGGAPRDAEVDATACGAVGAMCMGPADCCAMTFCGRRKWSSDPYLCTACLTQGTWSSSDDQCCSKQRDSWGFCK
jgi:hypothetical protein